MTPTWTMGNFLFYEFRWNPYKISLALCSFSYYSVNSIHSLLYYSSINSSHWNTNWKTEGIHGIAKKQKKIIPKKSLVFVSSAIKVFTMFNFTVSCFGWHFPASSRILSFNWSFWKLVTLKYFWKVLLLPPLGLNDT